MLTPPWAQEIQRYLLLDTSWVEVVKICICYVVQCATLIQMDHFLIYSFFFIVLIAVIFYSFNISSIIIWITCKTRMYITLAPRSYFLRTKPYIQSIISRSTFMILVIYIPPTSRSGFSMPIAIFTFFVIDVDKFIGSLRLIFHEHWLLLSIVFTLCCVSFRN